MSSTTFHLTGELTAKSPAATSPPAIPTLLLAVLVKIDNRPNSSSRYSMPLNLTSFSPTEGFEEKLRCIIQLVDPYAKRGDTKRRTPRSTSSTSTLFGYCNPHLLPTCWLHGSEVPREERQLMQLAAGRGCGDSLRVTYEIKKFRW